MSMSRKDYEAIAEGINSILYEQESCTLTVSRIMLHLGVIFEADNPRFDYMKFREACLHHKEGVTNAK